MTSYFKSLAMATIISLCASPAFAVSNAEGDTKGKEPANWSAVPKKTLALVVSSFAGVPIAMVRRYAHAEVDGAHGMVGDTENKFLLIPAGILWLPFAACLGVMEAPGCALKNSFYNFDKPFSKEQFSLGEMADNE
jgi:hypothetical protein